MIETNTMKNSNPVSRNTSKMKVLVASFIMLLSLTSCSLATVGQEEPLPPPVGNKEARNDMYYDGLVSSEMRNLTGIFQTYIIDNPDDFEAAGVHAKESYTPFEGVSWDYEIIDDEGYLIKVWTTDGGTSTDEETALIYDSTIAGYR